MKRTILAVLVFVAAVAVSCNEDTSKCPDTVCVGAVPALTDSTPEMDGYPGDGNTAGWREYVKKLDFNLEFKDFDSAAVITYTCKQIDTDCPASGGIRFMVVPEKHGYKADWDKVIKGNRKGLVVAAYWNMDRVRVPSLNNLPAHAPLYQWIGKTSANARGIQVFSVTDSTDVRIAAYGTEDSYEACKMTGDERKKPAAKLNPNHVCENVASAAQKSAAQSTPVVRSQARGSAPAVPLFPEDLWLSCAGGCCQSSLIQ